MYALKSSKQFFFIFLRTSNAHAVTAFPSSRQQRGSLNSCLHNINSWKEEINFSQSRDSRSILDGLSTWNTFSEKSNFNSKSSLSNLLADFKHCNHSNNDACSQCVRVQYLNKIRLRTNDLPHDSFVHFSSNQCEWWMKVSEDISDQCYVSRHLFTWSSCQRTVTHYVIFGEKMQL